MRSIRYLLGLLTVLSAFQGAAKNLYVRSSATGSNNGSDWNNAWTDTTRINWATVAPGDMIWIAGGTYGALSIQGSGNSTSRVYIQRVRTTNSAPASAAGWNSSFDSTVIVTRLSCNSVGYGNYVTVDGQVPYGGIIVTNTSLAEVYAVDLNASGANYMELFNLDIGGVSTLSANFTGEGRCISANFNGTAHGLHIAHCKLHGAPTLVLSGGQHDMIFEYNKLYDNVVGNPALWHPNVWNTIGNDVNVIFRYNEIWNWMVEGIMMSTGNADSDWYIYGNLWHGNPAFTVSRIVEAQYTTHGPVYMYNNTFVGVAEIVSGGNGAWGWDSRCASSNNIYFQCGGGAGAGHGFGKGHDDYDLSDAANSEPHGITGATSAMFVNFAGGNYHIVTNIAPTLPRNKGAALGAQYSVDMEGNPRGGDGAWDIGAFEYNTGSPVNNDTTPPTVSLTAPSGGATVSNLVALTANASDNVGGSGIASVIFRVDGSPVGTVSSGPYTMNWNSTSLPNGTHSVQAVASDVAGNQTTSASVSVSVANLVDTTPPTVTLTAPAASDVVSNTVTLTATAVDESGGSGIGGVTFLVDGASVGSISNSPFSVSWNSRGVANGSHSIQARALDVTGNQALSSSINVTVQNAALTISNGMIGYWQFNDGSGSAASDSSGNGNNGTLVGSATWGPGILSSSLSLDGQTGYVRVPSSASLEQVSTGLTVCAWVKFGTNIAYANGDMQSIARKVISETSNPSPYASYDLVVQDAGSGNFQARMAVTRASDSTRGIAWGSPHPYGAWYHFAGVYDGTRVRIYVNGVEESNAPFTGTLLQTTGQPLCIGRFGTVGEAVNGSIDDFRVYNRALSATEIQSFYDNAAPPAPFGLKIISNP
jgi:hypothetical protein